ncbi:MAG: HEAT repeat domain-containing protein [Acidobacteriota bacterium]
MHKTPLILLLALGLWHPFALWADSVPALAAALFSADERAASADASYRAGRRALDQSQWAEAARLFAESIDRGAGHDGAAHYWQAYALHKDNQPAEALEVLGELRRSFEASAWLDDSRALELEIRDSSGEVSVPAQEGDEELQILALNALIYSDADRALPLLRQFLAGDSRKLAQRALFVLSQSGSPAVAALLVEIARGNEFPKMQTEAIRWLGMSGVAGSGATLSEIYRSTADPEIKATVLRSFLDDGEADLLLQVARNESDGKLRRAAIHQLGVAGAMTALRQLYASETSLEVKQQILHSQYLAGDTQGLLETMRSETDEGLRRRAIRSLGMIGSAEGGAALDAMYDQETDPASRQRIIAALFFGNHAAPLIRIAKEEPTPKLRKEAIRRLSMMNSEEALAFLMEFLDP